MVPFESRAPEGGVDRKLLDPLSENPCIAQASSISGRSTAHVVTGDNALRQTVVSPVISVEKVTVNGCALNVMHLL